MTVLPARRWLPRRRSGTCMSTAWVQTFASVSGGAKTIAEPAAVAPLSTAAAPTKLAGPRSTSRLTPVALQLGRGSAGFRQSLTENVQVRGVLIAARIAVDAMDDGRAPRAGDERLDEAFGAPEAARDARGVATRAGVGPGRGPGGPRTGIADVVVIRVALVRVRHGRAFVERVAYPVAIGVDSRGMDAA